ncbi:MAG: dicarboxylate/amino acid:cation symporter [Phycisphaerales bacterium]|nr:dicarboxylate/amino acid:cation symporter [Phycisphaerales bacterium]
MMIVIPLVATSVVMGVSSIGDVRKLGKVGSLTMLYYFAGMIIACTVGVTLVTLIQPGEGMGVDIRQQGEAMYEGQDTVRQRTQTAAGKGLWGAVENITGQLIPANPIGAAADGQVLPVIAFSLLMGVMLTLVGEKAQPVLAVVEGIYLTIMKLVDAVLWLAPLGVFTLVAATVCRVGLVQLVGPLVWYVITVLGGLLIQSLIVMTLALWLLGRTNPFTYMHRCRAALMTAFGTSSSNATLPVTIDVATRLGGVSPRAAGFVIPLGATVNMNGTALYEAVAVVFLFQCYGINLGPVELAIVVITATLAAIGAAGIPSAGLVTIGAGGGSSE